MGSTGSGHLTDYSDYGNAVRGVTGGKDTVYICDRAVSTSLEDVSTSDYFKAHHSVPPKGTAVIISSTSRIVALDNTGLIIGNLPTEYNYLLACLEDGYQYEGEVSDTYEVPFPMVVIAVTPQKAK